MASGVYWLGSNGNIYVKSSSGVSSLGTGGTALSKAKSLGYTSISDPNAPKTGMTTWGTGVGTVDPNAMVIRDGLVTYNGTGGGTSGGGYTSSGGGGYAAPAPVGPTAEQVNPLLQSLQSLGEIESNKNAQTEAEYGRAIAGYDASDAIDLKNYQENVTGNEKAYTANNQAALLNAANASTGLRGVLSSMKALGGSGVNVVKRLVGLAANQDTGESRKNFDANASTINTGWASAEQQQRQRREDAKATRENNIQNNKASVLTSRQQIQQDLAKLYGPDSAEGKRYAAEAGALAAPIAATTRASVAPYAAASSAYSPAALQTYLAGTQNLNVSTSGGPAGTPINSPLFGRDKKDELPGVA